MSPADLPCSVGSHQDMALGQTFRPGAEGCKQGAGARAEGLQAAGFPLAASARRWGWEHARFPLEGEMQSETRRDLGLPLGYFRTVTVSLG